LIKAENVSLRYKDGTLALKDVNIGIQPGELVYILGPSGSGKTSLLKLLMGIEYPTSGSLEVMNLPMKRSKRRKIRKLRRNLGPIFQEFKLIEGRTALENVMMGMRILGIRPKRMREFANTALSRVGLEHKRFSKVEKLSWGEAQRVAIARAVARTPRLILADEPTGNLDHDNAVHILHLLNSFRNDHTTVVITTHATHLIQDFEDITILHVDQGNIRVERRGKRI